MLRFLSQNSRQAVKDNRVVIYVWFGTAAGGSDVGHAALKTPATYISLWPVKDTGKSDLASMAFEHRNGVNFHTYEDDVVAEAREPNFICCLYSLDVMAIEREFASLGPRIGNWSVLGNTAINRPNQHLTMSCSSLVYDLLIKGGIRSLTYIGLTVPMMPSPHNIFTIARSAKDYELKHYPQTHEFDLADGHIFNPHSEVSTMAIQQELKYRIWGL